MEIRKADEQEWNKFIKACPAATFFHSPQWHQVWQQYAGYGYEARMFEFESGRKALLPLSWKKRAKGLMKEYISSPAGTYGGFLVNELLSDAETKKLQDYIKGFALIQIRENPFQKILEDSFWTKSDFTQCIELNQTWEVISANMKNAQIERKVRIGERHFLKVRKIEFQEIKDYYKLYQLRREKWKFPTNNYQIELFELLQTKENVDFWGVFYKDRLVGGGPFFTTNSSHIVSWLSVCDPLKLHLKPYEYLYFNLIKIYKKKGFRWFDFNPSGGHEGVVKFKKGFGAEMRSAQLFVKQPKLLNKLSALNKKTGF